MALKLSHKVCSIILGLCFTFWPSSVNSQDADFILQKLQNLRGVNLEKGLDFKNWVNAIILDKEGILWASSGNILYTVDGVSVTVRAQIENKEEISFSQLCIINDTLYMWSELEAVHYLPLYGAEQYISKKDWDFRFVSHCSYQDHEHYFSTKEGGIISYKNGVFRTVFMLPAEYEDLEYNPNYGSLIVDSEDSNKLWFYNKNQLFHVNIEDGSYEVIDIYLESGIDLRYKAKAFANVSLIQIGDHLYLGSWDKGLIRYNTITKEIKQFLAVPPHYLGNRNKYQGVTQIMPHDENYLIIGGSFTNIFDIENEKYYDFNLANGKYSIYTIGQILKHDKIYFVNNFLGGVFIASPDNNKFINFEMLDSSAYHSRVNDSNGYEWIGNKNKLIQLDLNRDTLQKINTIEKFGTEISAEILVDRLDNIWLGSNTGIIKYDPGNDEFDLYTEYDGLQSEDWSSNFAPSMNSSGDLKFTTNNNSAILLSKSLQKKNKPGKPRITKIEVLGSAFFHDSSGDWNLELEPNEDYFTIYYSLLNYDQAQDVKFKYKLDGHDNDWIIGKPENYVSYNQVPPGNYEFLVQAVTSDNQSNPVYDNLKISIKAKWFESNWFKVLLFLLVAGLMFAFYKMRTSAIRRESQLKSNFNQELAQVKLEALRSQMNPHFLFNSLNSIDNFILSNEPTRASEYLSKFSKLIRNILDFSKSNSISLEQEIQTTKLYIEMEQMRFEDKFDYQFTMDPALNASELLVPPLILQPYVENAIWHGLLHKNDKGVLRINVRAKNKSLLFEIEDNGIGRKQAMKIKTKSAEKKKSHGMKITEERIQLTSELNGIGGDINITDKVDGLGHALGTLVSIVIPLMNKPA